jgi:sodium-dependent dicarboxylate transporter 2/3/5|tara:strand:+ start:4435 stop:5844 length:1410 start_codon:yes stop_codon:yes gene_type:complete
MNESYKIISSSILFWFSQKKWFVYSILVSIFLLNLSTPIGLSVPAYHSLIILVLVFMLVTFEPIPFPAIALLTLVLQVVLGVAPPDQVASSFMNDAVLFVMGSLMFAIAIVHQGLDIRLARFIVFIFGKSKRMFLAGLMSISAILSSFLGEHTVIAIMLPIGLSVIKNIDTQQPDGKNAVLITLFSIAYGTIIGSIGTPSGGARNVIMINYLQEFSNVHIDYWKWMKHAYPILIIQLIVAYFVLQFAFPSSLKNIKMRGYKKNVENRSIKKDINHLFSCLIIIAIIASWFTFNDIYGLGIIALGGALTFMIFGMITWEEINKNTNWGVILLFAATISLGFQINETGASSWLVIKFNELLNSLPSNSMNVSWSIMAILSGLTANFFTSSATVSLIGPMAIELHPTDISFALSSAIASGFSFLTVISSPTAMIIYSTGLVSTKVFFRVGILMFIISILILYLMSQFYWVTL